MEDISGTSIKSLLPPKGFPLEDFFYIAIGTVLRLAEVHATGVVHREINPNNIIVNTTTKTVTTIDFENSSRLSKEAMVSVGTHLIRGTCLYMSPEQTGRMNRLVDYRSDFYSLGATFYEMLCGSPPFKHTLDALELIHKHIAVKPKQLCEVTKSVPKPLSDVVVKLLEKNAEDRYQDCQGILADLTEIRDRLRNNVSLVDYKVGRKDYSHHFQVSQKLYGREALTCDLKKCFDDVSSGKVPVILMLVHGYSGIGKTTLINEIHKPLVRNRGYYLCGKFNQMAENVPYAVLLHALKQFVKHILTESEEKLARCGERLQNALGTNGQLMVEVLPELEIVIGPQPPVNKLSAIDSQHRFRQVFTSFISSLATRKHPIVIFLDDLHRADTSTLSMIATLLTSPASNHLLLLGAYRDNEVDDMHPLICTIRDARAKGANVRDFTLQPLRLADVYTLIHDSCTVNHEYVHDCEKEEEAIQEHEMELAKVVFKKTEGNPFFVNQLLSTLYQDGHISLRTGPIPRWECDMDKVYAANYTNNVADLMVAKIRKTSEVQKVLGIAAQIGTEFDLGLLAHLCNLTPADTLLLLRVPILENFVVMLDSAFDVMMANGAAVVRGNVMREEESERKHNEDSNTESGGSERSSNESKDEYTEEGKRVRPRGDMHEEHFDDSSDNASASTGGCSAEKEVGSPSSGYPRFRFGHDRIQQTSASLVAVEEVPKIHFRIAEYLLSFRQDNPKMLQKDLLLIVNHLNIGYPAGNLAAPLAPFGGKFLPLQADSIAELNLQAAIKSKNTNACAQALVYADTGLSILLQWEGISWDRFYPLMFALYSQKAEMCYLMGDFEGAEAIYPILLGKATSNEDKCNVYLIMCFQYEMQSRYAEVLEHGQKPLKLFGLILPEPHDEDASKASFARNAQEVQRILASRGGAKTLLSLSMCANSTARNVMRLLQSMLTSAYILGKVPFSRLLSAHLALISMDQGLCEESVVGLGTFGMHLGIEQHVAGYEIARVAIVLADTHYPQTRMTGRVYLIYSMCNSWHAPVHTTLGYLLKAYEIAQQTSFRSLVCYCVPYIVEFPFFSGAPLEESMRLYQQYVDCLVNNKIWYLYLLAGTQPIRDLIGEPFHFLQGAPFEGSDYEKESWLNVTYYYANTLSCFFMQRRQNWLAYADTAIVLVPKLLTALFKKVETYTIVSLLYLDWLSRSPLARELYGANTRREPPSSTKPPYIPLDHSDIETEHHLPRDRRVALICTRIANIEACISNLTELTAAHEGNFHHKLLLVQAECARLNIILGSSAAFTHDHSQPQLQDFEEAMDMYERAIQSARTHGFTQYEALGLELYARFWLTAPARPKVHVAGGYLEEAIFTCERWGALAKADLLRETYSEVLTELGLHELVAGGESKAPSAQEFSPDLETVVKASQTISKELDMPQLIRQMMKVMVESSGAKQGTLFVVDDENGALLISAEYFEIKVSDKAETQREIIVYTDSKPVIEWVRGSFSVVNSVLSTLLPIVLNCAFSDAQFGLDPYIKKNRAKSVLGMPILLKNVLKGVLYLENNMHQGLFTKHRMDLLLILTSQTAITLENARFFKAKMREHIEQLRFEQLTHDEERQRLRADTAEKYRSQLENFMDMICHEIRNPLNGILGNSDLICYYLKTIEVLLTKAKKERTLSSGDIIVVGGELRNFLEQIKMSANYMQICAEHQKCITDDVLQLSKLRVNKFVLNCNFFYASELWDNLLRMFGVKAVSKGLDLTLNLPEGKFKDVELWADSLRITQILTNLMANAIKFTETGGIKVTAAIEEDLKTEFERFKLYNREEEAADCARISTTQSPQRQDHSNKQKKESSNSQKSKKNLQKNPTENEVTTNVPAEEITATTTNIELINGRATQRAYLKVIVSDTGKGMTEEEQERIFTPFSQANKRTSTEYGGSGLGMSICKCLAKLMNGYLYVESKKGVGTTFYLSILCSWCCDNRPKLHPPPPQPTLAPTHPPQQAISGSKDILVVEDNLMNQLLLTRILKCQGYTVHVASNGMEGFEKYKEKPSLFPHVLMDIQMPVMDGLEATVKIRDYETKNHVRGTYIIGLSGNASIEYKKQAIAAGMNEYITKPYHKETLFAMLGQVDKG